MKPGLFFKTVTRFFLSVVILGICHASFAQAPPALPDTSKMTYNQLSSTLKLYVYPAKGQNQQQQKKDEFDCYKWAMEQSGIDPLNPPKVEAAPAQTGPTGGAVRGAAKGAAAGVAIGAIAGDAGEVQLLALLPVAWLAGARGSRHKNNKTNRHRPMQPMQNRKRRTAL